VRLFRLHAARTRPACNLNNRTESLRPSRGQTT